ncbi:MAG: hypothetical protein M1834_001237 [Cirrosporium novae-zelandiae]|nr:MAG: hypothetical protein M1834_001237 [Cirrosporium novae-zelandiae]
MLKVITTSTLEWPTFQKAYATTANTTSNPPRRRAGKSLMDLPPELRMQIYEKLLSHPRCQNTQILRVCRTIYWEARSALFKRGIDFESQSDLYAWLQRVDQGHLSYVTGLGIRLQDVSGDDLFASLSDRIQQAKMTTSSSKHKQPSLYSREIERLRPTLALFYNVKEFKIYKPRSNEIPPDSEMYEGVLHKINNLFPKLERLSLYIDKIPMSSVARIRTLKSLCFTGFSVASPEELAAALQRIPHFEAIELHGPPTRLGCSQRHSHRRKKVVQTMTPSVLKAIPPLKSYTIFEDKDSDRDGPVFLNSKLWRTLRDYHGSLKTLRIQTDVSMASEGRSAFRDLLRSSSLRELAVCWSSHEDGVKDVGALPKSLRVLELSISHREKEARKVAEALISRRKDLRRLSELTLKVNWARCGPSKHLAVESSMAAIIPHLREAGFRASWTYWVPGRIVQC